MILKNADVLKNLKDYSSWDYVNYKLTKNEADVIIPALSKQVAVPCKVLTDSDTDERGSDLTWDVYCCPICNEKYRFNKPKYCNECGQKLKY